MGTIAALPDDISPFQIGTAGQYKNIHFLIIGRVRMSWENGGWNEWFLWLNNGQKGWLAEAQGFLAISFEQDLPEYAEWKHKPLGLEQNITIGGEAFTIADCKEAECTSCEGELPSFIKSGQKSYVADALNSAGKFVSLSCDQSWYAKELFIGSYIEFNALNFKNLRELPGWKLPSPHLQRTKQTA